MKKLFVIIAMMVCPVLQLLAHTDFGEQPKLVVGIAVDQMRWDYLSRYYNRFQKDGLRRLIDQGYSCDNCLINYVPTVTAIGHTSIYTGATPAFHGICGNAFYVGGKRTSSCTDESVMTVGSGNQRVGQRSPHYLLSTTIGDQLRLHTDFAAKVVSVSYKDRAAILPGGRSANAAYWLDTDNRCFVTSTYYMNELPRWAQDYNLQLKANAAFQRLGNRIGYDPLCGTITAGMAMAALKGEQLGQRGTTDMLCVSFSQTDVMGHEWGTRGERIGAAYLQLDKDIASLLHALDEQVGEGNYLVFLTADHGAAHNSHYMENHKLNGGAWKWEEELGPELDKWLTAQLGLKKPVIKDVIDYRVFLDRESIREQGLDEQRVRTVVADGLKRLPHVQFVIDFEQAAIAGVPAILRERALMGYHPGRSGDILFVLEAGYYGVGRSSSPVGTTHGEWNPYDAHIPLLFYGWKVSHGSTGREVHITDIAPTVCQLLHIQQPNACVGEAIPEIVK